MNKSIGATTWLWDFGDGVTLTDQKVSHTYAAPGTYQTMLKVTNGVCENTIKKDVVVINEQGSLGTSITESCINTSVTFSIAGLNVSNINSYAWYFNGISQKSVITSNNPVASVYNTAGIRYPAAVVTDKLNCRDTLYAAVPVTIYGPKAAFVGLNAGTCLGNTVTFTDSTKTDGIHPLTTWIWNYGEGAAQTYTSSPFSHNYPATGDYTVKLVVKDTYGCTDSLTKPAFYIRHKTCCQLQSVRYFNLSSGAC